MLGMAIYWRLNSEISSTFCLSIPRNFLIRSFWAELRRCKEAELQLTCPSVGTFDLGDGAPGSISKGRNDS
jgi:hypothetical protein